MLHADVGAELQWLGDGNGRSGAVLAGGILLAWMGWLTCSCTYRLGCLGLTGTL